MKQLAEYIAISRDHSATLSPLQLLHFYGKYDIINAWQNTKIRQKAVHLEGRTMYPQYHQMTLEEYEFPFGKLDPENE